MARQAENTLYSLSTHFQRNVAESDYEVVCVENESDQNLDPARVAEIGSNIRYFRRRETGQSPAAAINHAFEQVRAPMICLMVDGARMVSPRVIEYALMGQRIDPHALIAIPGYHLGPDEQHQSPGYDERAEMALLEGIDWKRNGYRLFDISVFSGANPHGYLHPLLESNCLFCASDSFDGIGRADERFDLPGGGMINLDLYRRLALLPESRLMVTPGEGSFHQFHGGVTTSDVAEREAVLASHRAQYRAIRDEEYRGVLREPMLLGAVTGEAIRFFTNTAQGATRRFGRFQAQGRPPWPDDPRAASPGDTTANTD
jgi:glycosyltransferase involved in cell wall biosynthesis